MRIIDLRDNEKDATKIIFGEHGDYLTDDANIVDDDDQIAICYDTDNIHFLIYKRDINLLIEALKLAKEWK